MTRGASRIGRAVGARVLGVKASLVVTLALVVALPGYAAEGAETAGPAGEERPAGEEHRPLLTLQAVVDVARARSPLVSVAEARGREAHWQRVEASALRWPRFELSGGLAPAPRVREEDEEASDLELLARFMDGFGPSLRAEFTATMPLFTFGKLRIARELASLGVDASELETRRAALTSVVQAYRAYALLQWHREIRALLDEALGRLNRAEEKLEDRLDDGDPTARTQLRKLTLLRARIVRLETEADSVAGNARAALETLLDLPAGFVVEPWQVWDTAQPPALEDLVALARQHRPEAQLLDAAVEARRLQASLEWRRLAPDVVLGAQVSGAWTPTIENRSGPFVYDPYNRFGAGVFLGMRAALDVFTRRAAAGRAEARVETAQQERSAAWRAIALEIRQARDAVLAQGRVLGAYEEAMRAARAWLQQTAFQFDQGLADFDELADPLAAYYEAAGQVWEIRLQERLRWVDLALHLGLDDPGVLRAAE